MLQTSLWALTQILFFATILVFVVGWYQQHKFLEAWREDHGQSLPWLTRNRLAAGVLLSKALSDRCRDRRRKLLMAIATLFGLLLAVTLLTAVQIS